MAIGTKVKEWLSVSKLEMNEITQPYTKTNNVIVIGEQTKQDTSRREIAFIAKDIIDAKALVEQKERELREARTKLHERCEAFKECCGKNGLNLPLHIELETHTSNPPSTQGAHDERVSLPAECDPEPRD